MLHIFFVVRSAATHVTNDTGSKRETQSQLIMEVVVMIDADGEEIEEKKMNKTLYYY